MIREFTKCSPTDYQANYCYSTSQWDPRNYSTYPCSKAHDNGGSRDGTIGDWSNPLLSPESW